MNQVVLIGRLTRDPELRYIQGSGTPVANFAIAVDREFKGKDGQKETDFIDIQVWGKSAENCANYIGKGSLVGISGSIRVDTYQNQQGENRKAFRVNANRVQFLDNRNNNQGGQQGQPQGQWQPQGQGGYLGNQDFNPGFSFDPISDDDLPF